MILQKQSFSRYTELVVALTKNNKTVFIQNTINTRKSGIHNPLVKLLQRCTALDTGHRRITDHRMVKLQNISVVKK